MITYEYLIMCCNGLPQPLGEMVLLVHSNLGWSVDLLHVRNGCLSRAHVYDCSVASVPLGGQFHFF